MCQAYGDLRDGPKVVLALQAFKRQKGPYIQLYKHPQAGDGGGPRAEGRMAERAREPIALPK